MTGPHDTKRQNIRTQRPVDAKYHYSPAVIRKRSRLLSVSDVCGWDGHGNIVHADDVAKRSNNATGGLLRAIALLSRLVLFTSRSLFSPVTRPSRGWL
jgi:hypothetical protein